MRGKKVNSGMIPFNFDNIPEEIKRIPKRFGLMSYDKTPLFKVGRRYQKVSERKNGDWRNYLSDFDEVVKDFDVSEHKAPNFYLYSSDNNRIGAIDEDNCLNVSATGEVILPDYKRRLLMENGELASPCEDNQFIVERPSIHEVIQLFKSYCEVSPSETGLRIFFGVGEGFKWDFSRWGRDFNPWGSLTKSMGYYSDYNHSGTECYISDIANTSGNEDYKHSVSFTGKKIKEYTFKGERFSCDYSFRVIPKEELEEILSKIVPHIQKEETDSSDSYGAREFDTVGMVDGVPCDDLIKKGFNDNTRLFELNYRDGVQLKNPVKNYSTWGEMFRAMWEGKWHGNYFDVVNEDGEILKRDFCSLKNGNDYSSLDYYFLKTINRYTLNNWEKTWEIYFASPYFNDYVRPSDIAKGQEDKRSYTRNGEYSSYMLDKMRDKRTLASFFMADDYKEITSKQYDKDLKAQIENYKTEGQTKSVTIQEDDGSKINNGKDGEMTEGKLNSSVMIDNCASRIGVDEGNEALNNIVKELEAKEKEAKEKETNDRALIDGLDSTLQVPNFFANIDSGVFEKRIPIGIESVDNALSGGMYDGLMIIGGESSIGKTTLLLQIALEQIKNNRDVIMFSCEQSKEEIYTKIMIRLVAQLKDDKGLTKDFFSDSFKNIQSRPSSDNREIIMQARKLFLETIAPRLYIYNPESILVAQDIKRITQLLMTSKGMTEAPIIFVDYLQMLAPFQELDEKGNPKKAYVTESEASGIKLNVSMIRQYAYSLHTVCFMLSSFNRPSQDGKKSYSSFNGSSGIEYGADVLVALDFDTKAKNNVDMTDEEREANRKSSDLRRLTMDILKNRNGKRPELKLNFHPSTQIFTDKEEVSTPHGKAYVSCDDSVLEEVRSNLNHSWSLDSIRATYDRLKLLSPNSYGVKLTDFSKSSKEREKIKAEILNNQGVEREFFIEGAKLYDREDYTNYTSKRINKITIDEEKLKSNLLSYLNKNKKELSSLINLDDYSLFVQKDSSSVLETLRKSKHIEFLSDNVFHYVEEAQ